jgi:hypothetical protein
LNIPPLQIQKHQRELEIIIQECILNTVRESIPVESILRAYMDETVEEDVVEEIKEEVVEKPVDTKDNNDTAVESSANVPLSNESKSIPKLESDDMPIVRKMETEMNASSGSGSEFPELSEDTSLTTNKLSFNDVDMVKYSDNVEENISAPKSIERLEQISDMRNTIRKYESDDDDDEIPSKLKILDQYAELDQLDIHSIDPPEIHLDDDYLLNDIEVLA